MSLAPRRSPVAHASRAALDLPSIPTTTSPVRSRPQKSSRSETQASRCSLGLDDQLSALFPNLQNGMLLTFVLSRLLLPQRDDPPSSRWAETLGPHYSVSRPHRASPRGKNYMGPIIREAWPRPSRSTGDEQDPSQASRAGVGVPAAGDQAAFSPVGTGGTQGLSSLACPSLMPDRGNAQEKGPGKDAAQAGRGEVGEASAQGAWLAPRTFRWGLGVQVLLSLTQGPPQPLLAVKFEF